MSNSKNILNKEVSRRSFLKYMAAGIATFSFGGFFSFFNSDKNNSSKVASASKGGYGSKGYGA